jgi:hypothetical protein
VAHRAESGLTTSSDSSYYSVAWLARLIDLALSSTYQRDLVTLTLLDEVGSDNGSETRAEVLGALSCSECRSQVKEMLNGDVL